MPILAVVFVTETSVKVGLAFGNEALTVTLSATPSTTIWADVGFSAGAAGVGTTATWGWEEPDVVPPGACVGMTLVAAGAVGVAAVAGVDALALCFGASGSVLTCWTKGSLLLKRENETSWPVSGVAGTVVFAMPMPPGVTTAVACAVGAAVAVAPGVVAGMAIPPGPVGVVPTAAAVASVVAGAVACDSSAGGFAFSIFSVRGPWIASRPTNRTPPTARMIFCRFSFAAR